jgi:hypothetical protein
MVIDRKCLLKKIWGRAGRLAWDEDKLYKFLIDYGFESRLSEMNVFQLNALYTKIDEHYQKVKNDLDDRGKFMYATMIKAKWHYKALNSWMKDRFRINKSYTFTDTWRNLNEKQRSGVIGMLENYKTKNKDRDRLQ